MYTIAPLSKSVQQGLACPQYQKCKITDLTKSLNQKLTAQPHTSLDVTSFIPNYLYLVKSDIPASISHCTPVYPVPVQTHMLLTQVPPFRHEVLPQGTPAKLPCAITKEKARSEARVRQMSRVSERAGAISSQDLVSSPL